MAKKRSSSKTTSKASTRRPLPRAAGKKKAGKKTATAIRDAKERTATSAEPAQPATVEDWFASVRAVAAASSQPRGACLVPNPAGGPRMCIFTDRTTCKTMKGTFVDGPC
jgi:hypothetical protein